MSHWVMDWETIINTTVLVVEDYKKEDTRVFVVHKLRNDLPELIKFLEDNKKNKEWHVSFNGLSFDSQITEYLLQDKDILLKMRPEEVAYSIYKKAQSIIERQNAGEWQEYSERQLSIKQVDVFKLNHWDNPAKRSSLKWIQYSMDWFNIQDMPIHHSTVINTLEEIDTIVSYCINDVRSTKRIMELSKDQINLRGALTKEYGISLYSASEPRIAKEMFLHFLSKTTGMRKYDLRYMRTNRTIINIKDIILPYISFKRPEFQSLLEKFRELSINPENTKGGFKYSVKYRGVRTDFGLGGVHGARESGEYIAKDGMTIMTSDVTSFYPNLAIRNKWAPAHLPAQEFSELYEWFFEERKKIPKKDPRNYVYKIVLNSTFGLSIDKNSFLYDPQFGMQITINGQLTLMMLYEMLAEAIPEAVPIMQNTDGLEMMIPTHLKDKYLAVCKEWEKLTSLQLEHGEYQKIILADVNNYIGVYKYKEVTKEEFESLKKEQPQDLFKVESSKYLYAGTKCKGRFEFRDLALHKNKSFLIVSKAIFYYFIHNIPPEKYLIDNRNIFDYCGGVKIKGNWKFYTTCVVDGVLSYEDLQKTLRYYISNKGCKIIKRNLSDDREIQLESGKWLQRIFNVYEDCSWEERDVNDSFYLDKIYREISNISEDVTTEQLSLF